MLVAIAEKTLIKLLQKQSDLGLYCLKLFLSALFFWKIISLSFFSFFHKNVFGQAKRLGEVGKLETYI